MDIKQERAKNARLANAGFGIREGEEYDIINGKIVFRESYKKLHNGRFEEFRPKLEKWVSEAHPELDHPLS